MKSVAQFQKMEESEDSRRQKKDVSSVIPRRNKDTSISLEGKASIDTIIFASI